MAETRAAVRASGCPQEPRSQPEDPAPPHLPETITSTSSSTRDRVSRVRAACRALDAMKHGKHFIMMNAELDATLGPILQVYARRYGVVFSACDGDEPGVQMNLYRWVKGLGLIPRVIGNVKGLQDPYRNPTTQAGFAEKWGQIRRWSRPSPTSL